MQIVDTIRPLVARPRKPLYVIWHRPPSRMERKGRTKFGQAGRTYVYRDSMCYTPLILYIGDRANGDVDSGRDREWQLLDRALVDASMFFCWCCYCRSWLFPLTSTRTDWSSEKNCRLHSCPRCIVVGRRPKGFRHLGCLGFRSLLTNLWAKRVREQGEVGPD